MSVVSQVALDAAARRADGLAKNEGFFLDLKDSWHDGDARVGSTVVAPVSYVFKSGHYVTYYFMYGFNKPSLSGLPDVADKHEGEWERITVRLDANNRATAVWYFQHFCDAEPYTWNQMTSKGYLDGTHPIVYSANGSRASYPRSDISIGKSVNRPGVSGDFLV